MHFGLLCNFFVKLLKTCLVLNDAIWPVLQCFRGTAENLCLVLNDGIWPVLQFFREIAEKQELTPTVVHRCGSDELL